VGTPAEIYDRPATPFVADFIGASNLVEGDAALQLFGDATAVSLRPERIRVATTDAATRPGEQAADGKVVDVVYAGASTRYVVALDAGPAFVVVEPAGGGAPTGPARRGDRVRLAWDRESVFRLG
jgi:putative spermidine/putrescine transport system ATP-binding protein